ncbi:hypothetical protein PM082_014812 [Marasmius tenuissimus]|nr:hypothetical protein PM082_014812 [Marasmius tenuissimus]
MSTFFANAQNFAIDGGNFGIVQGDQINYYRQRISQVSEATSASSSPLASGFRSITEATSSRTMVTVQINGNQINQIIQREEREHTEFDDFRNVKRGDIYKIRTICEVRDGAEGCQCEACQRERGEVTRTFCSAKLIGVEGEFTAVTYSGRDARKVFEWEFLKYSRTQFTGASQIFAIDKGTIPSMVLWHNLVPLAQFKGNVRGLGLRYLESLRRQLGCWDEELWMDSSRGVICRGPEGPYSQLPVYVLELKDLPPTAELLQEEVLVRFLASHKSKEADDAFMHAMHYGRNNKDVPERVNGPTVFSTLTKTPIAVANNVWESRRDNLVERTCLENGWTRFRLDGDGSRSLRLNRDVEKAWLWQAWRVFHARGVSLENDQEGFNLVYPYMSLDGYVNDSPSKRQRRQQQAIFLFVYSPPPNPTQGKTSPLHHWSFHEDGHSQISPELCCNLGLPVQLNFGNDFYACSWSTHNYKLIRQYQTLRGFDPTTADFAQHLGYGDHIFHPLDDSDRFKDVHEDQTSPSPQAPTDLGESVNIVNSEYPSNMLGLIRAEDMASVGDPHYREDKYTDTSYCIVPNKRWKTGVEHGGIVTHNHPHEDFRHKVDLTSNEQVVINESLRLIRPLPARTSRMNRSPCVQQGASASQLYPLHHYPSDNPVSRCHPSLPTSLSPRDVSSPYGLMTSTANIFDPFPLLVHTAEQSLDVSHATGSNSYNTAPPFGPYSIPEHAYSISHPTASTAVSPYTDPSPYLVSTNSTTEYDANAGHDFRWSGDWQYNTSNQHSRSSFVTASNSNPIYGPSPASTSTVSHLSHSVVENRTHPPYSMYGGVPTSLEYPSSFPDSSVGHQHERNGFALYSQPPPVIPYTWAGSAATPSRGQLEPSSFGYGGSEEWGRNNDGERWF